MAQGTSLGSQEVKGLYEERVSYCPGRCPGGVLRERYSIMTVCNVHTLSRNTAVIRNLAKSLVPFIAQKPLLN
jgi:hypothetical protein